MSDKETVIDAVRELPDQATFNEILEHLAIIAAVRCGLQDAEAGRLISHEEVKKRFAPWISE